MAPSNQSNISLHLSFQFSIGILKWDIYANK